MYFNVTRDPAAEADLLAVRDLIFDKYYDAAANRFKDSLTYDLSTEVDTGANGGDITNLLVPGTSIFLPNAALLTDPARRAQFENDLRLLTQSLIDKHKNTATSANPWMFWGRTLRIGNFNAAQTDFGHNIKSYEMIHNATRVALGAGGRRLVAGCPCTASRGALGRHHPAGSPGTRSSRMSTLTLRQADECRYDMVSLGEVMLRLDPGEGRIRTAREFRVWEGGGEYNVARGLRRCFGLRTAVVTAFADNDVGRLVEDLMLQGGVDTRSSSGCRTTASAARCATD